MLGKGRDSKTTLLIVDDDAADRLAITRAMRGVSSDYEVAVAHDGVEALELLKGTSGPRLRGPVVVLLDLKMPRMDGFEFLDALRADPELTHIVVFVLSTSGAPTDIRAVYQRQAAGYLKKTEVGIEPELLRDLMESYLSAVHLPS
jgi:CheY-like chemotaxis protein